MGTANIISENPLKSFFRKSKFKMTLPSAGKWYPENSINLNQDGSVDVFAMNAADDIRFRTGELALNGKSTISLINSCIPNIVNPEFIPSIDLDPLLLAIRSASYGDDFTISVSVPKTTLIRKLDLKISDLLNELPSDPSHWDTELTIENEDELKLNLNLIPINLGQLFTTTKTISNQRRTLSSVLDQTNQKELSDDQLQKFDDSVNKVTKTAISLICESIQTVTLIDKNGTTLTKLSKNELASQMQIRQLVDSLDVNYFNAIRDHLDTQRKKYTIQTKEIESTTEEIAAGADKFWKAEIVFAGSEFFGK